MYTDLNKGKIFQFTIKLVDMNHYICVGFTNNNEQANTFVGKLRKLILHTQNTTIKQQMICKRTQNMREFKILIDTRRHSISLTLQ